jgi:Rad3-related DNA helicase
VAAPDDPALPNAVRQVLAVLAAGQPMTDEQLVDAARWRFPGQHPHRITELIAAAVTAGAAQRSSDGLLTLTPTADDGDADAGTPHGEASGGSDARPDRPLCAVAVDLESVVRTTATAPFTDKRIFQVGAVRFGTDEAWVNAQPEFSAYLELPDETWQIRSDAHREAHTRNAVPPAQALVALHAFCTGADSVVTYNGTEADFPLLAQSYEREQLPTLDPAAVDVYYLALALWPNAKTHRLALLADELGIDRTGLGWHDAVDDCHLLILLVNKIAETFAGWDAPLRNLVTSVCPDSPAWALLRHLAAAHVGLPPGQLLGAVADHSQADVDAVLSTHLTGRTPRRAGPGPAPGLAALAVSPTLRGPSGRVDPVLLASVAHGSDAKPRQAQQQMTDALHNWADRSIAGFLEAPTGTGKSFAVLAAALDWLAADPRHTAIITTFTKQLQQQLADDVAILETAVPGLLEASDAVKGQANRLSLRALTVVLADATTALARGRVRPGTPNRFLTRPLFRETVTFVLLRLLAADTVQSGWVARSVDPVDCPAFFLGYGGPALSVWLESMSQASNGEYPVQAATTLAAHTDVVREALSSHRLLLANHALLLAHLDDLGSLSADTLLIVDEAHQLEDAATSALTTTLDYRTIEDLSAELDTWVRTARAGAERDAAREAVENLGILLDHEHLPKIAGMAFDARGTGVGTVVGSRTVTLASSYAGTGGVAQVRHLTAMLTRLGGQCEALVGAIGAYTRAHAGTLDFFEVERATALLTRCAATTESAQTIVDDITTITGPTGGPPAPGAGGGGQGGPAPAGAGGAAPDTGPSQDSDSDSASGTGAPGPEDGSAPDDDVKADDTTDNEQANEQSDDEPDRAAEGNEDDRADEGGPEGGIRLGDLPPDTSNQVVYAEELGALSEGLRRYQFRIATSPIELGANADWQQFLQTFARTYYVSATLRVAGRWDFITSRLGLPAGIATLALGTPFQLGRQAELICLSDFPSWAEQSDGAMRTVAHQLAGYSREIIRPVPAPDGERPVGTRGGYDGGALVLTTARSTAGGIAQYLATELRQRGDDTPVHSAIVLGNPRGVRMFTDPEYGGGFLVGTKGLWQGVDVSDERRLRLVWVNKLPFAPFAAPVIEARREAVRARAESGRSEDPDAVATSLYYLPLAALQLRQAVGRLIRSERHRGVIVISDRKLAGQTALRRAYRDVFLGSLDDTPSDGSPSLLRPDPVTGEHAGGNVVTMAEGWSRIWQFLADNGLLDPARAAELQTDEALEEQTLLPQTRRIRQLAMTREDVAAHQAAGTFDTEVLTRAAQIGGLLGLSDTPTELKASQQQVITAVANGRNVLGLLPTGFGKSFCFQLPALVLPGVTLIVSPLVALMHDQALELNRSIGGAVRALVAPLRESSSRAGKTEVADQLLGRADHGIRMVYVSPERLCQRRFREVVRQAVADGTISRIALDEAHTFVQWDDFRPSISRVEIFLAELGRDFGLPVTALTATANRTVHAGLREGVFGLTPDVLGGPAGEAAEAAAGGLITVRENPIRAELAVFRRSVAAAGESITAGLAEEVLETVEDHAIFYCLTVKQVVALHAHLREYLGEAGVRVRRFHGRLTEVEKSAVMTEFREAPKRGDEGFAPLIVVATSAFGLGINRPDVRTVFCVSAPTDLAALYQQLGRAGRDAAGRGPGGAAVVGGELPDPDGTGEAPTGSSDDGLAETIRVDAAAGVVEPAADSERPAAGDAAARPAGEGTPGETPVPNLGLTLMTNRGLRTVAFMTGSDLRPALLDAMGRAVLACQDVLDPSAVADALVGADLATGVLSADEARRPRTAEQYQAGVVRAFAALVGLGAVDDLGDFPPVCAVKAGELLGGAPEAPPQPTTDEERETTVVAEILRLSVRDARPGALRRRHLRVDGLDTHLATVVPEYRRLADDAAGTWQLLSDLHDRGLLDVSAAPSRRLVTGIAVNTTTLPVRYQQAVSGKAARSAAELALLRDFFADSTVCANRKFADYFGVPDLPDGCCTTAENRCSACWDSGNWPLGETKPASAVALETPRPRPAGQRVDATFRARRLDEQVSRLVWEVFRGVHPLDLQRALRGEDSYYQPARRRRVRLRSGLVTSRFFGASPGVRLVDIEDSLARLRAAGKVEQDGPIWRDRGHARRAAAGAARHAAQASQQPPQPGAAP